MKKKRKAGRPPKFTKADAIFEMLQGTGLAWTAKGIAGELGISERTLYTYIQRYSCPVRYSPSGVMWAFKQEVLSWLWAFSEFRKGATVEEVKETLNHMMSKTCPRCGHVFR